MTSAHRMNRETVKRYRERAPQTPKWNFAAMGQGGPAPGQTAWIR